jgi:hypothetical protein
LGKIIIGPTSESIRKCAPIKPAGGTSQIPQIFKERSLQAATHQIFTEKFGGKVFYIISMQDGKKKKICNPEVIKEIENEINKLREAS